jgi:hypothetical protein
MQKCEVCKRKRDIHVNHEMNLKFNFCRDCAKWLPQSFFDTPTQIISGTSAQKLLKDKKLFRQLWSKISHHVYQFNSTDITDILLAHSSSSQEIDFYEKRLDELSSTGYNMYHNKTILRGHFVFWTVVLKKG